MSRQFQILVANKRDRVRDDGECEYVGRPGALGNPFKIGEHGDRFQVVSKFRRWAAGELRSNPRGLFARSFLALEQRVKERNARGESTVLVCWCHPEACHADVLRSMLIRRLRWRHPA